MSTIFIIIIIVLIWCWNFLWNHPEFDKILYRDIEPLCKSGDLILFHGLDTFNAAYIGCYYTHIGMIYRNSPNERPLLFEAWNSSHAILYPDEIRDGIALSDLETRIESYRGYIFYKPLVHSLTYEQTAKLAAFIEWAHIHMHYNTHVIKNGIKKLLFNEELTVGTNCGEIMYLALIAMGLLPDTYFTDNRKHHLRWICNLQDINGIPLYLPMVYIWQNYFNLPRLKRHSHDEPPLANRHSHDEPPLTNHHSHDDLMNSSNDIFEIPLKNEN